MNPGENPLNMSTLPANNMTASHRYLSSFTRSLGSPFCSQPRPNSSVLPFLCPLQQQSRGFRTTPSSKTKATKAKKKRKTFQQYDMKDAVQFSLCDAMRYHGDLHELLLCFCHVSRLTNDHRFRLATDTSVPLKWAESSTP